MGVNMDVSLLIGEINNKAYVVSKKEQPNIKRFKEDTEFKSILEEKINNINEEENFSHSKDDVNTEQKTKVNNDDENLQSNTEQDVKADNNKTEDNQPVDSDNKTEDVESEVNDNTASEQNNDQDDEEDITKQNSNEIVVDILPDDTVPDKLIVQDDSPITIDLVSVSDEVNPENIKAAVENLSSGIKDNLDVSGKNITAQDTVKIPVQEETGILNSGNETKKNNAGELLNSKELNLQDIPADKSNESQTDKTDKTEINQTLNNELQPSVDLTKESEIVEKAEKFKTSSKNNTKKTDKVLDEQTTSEQIVPLKQNQDELDLSFSQEQSADSSLTNKNFDKLTEKIVTEEKDVLKDETAKDFTLVTNRQDTDDKMKTVKADAEIKESNFKEIFKQKVNADEIIKQVQAKLNVRSAGNANYSEIRFRLNPDNLGEVSMKITMENNTLTARMRVENEAVKEVFEANFEELKKSLNNQGVKVEKIEVTLKNDTSNMDSSAGNNLTNERSNKGNNNSFSGFSGGSNNNEQNNDNNITLTSRNRPYPVNGNDGHVDYLA